MSALEAKHVLCLPWASILSGQLLVSMVYIYAATEYQQLIHRVQGNNKIIFMVLLGHVLTRHVWY